MESVIICNGNGMWKMGYSFCCKCNGNGLYVMEILYSNCFTCDGNNILSFQYVMEIIRASCFWCVMEIIWGICFYMH